MVLCVYKHISIKSDNLEKDIQHFASNVTIT